MDERPENTMPLLRIVGEDITNLIHEFNAENHEMITLQKQRETDPIELRLLVLKDGLLLAAISDKLNRSNM